MRLRHSILATLVIVFAACATAGAANAARTPDPARATGTNADSILYAVRFQSSNKIGMALTNYGFIGTDFHNGNSSFEYPLGTGHMHMVRGGLWVGGLTIDNNGAFIGVSTAAQDANAGADAASAKSKISEFTPAGNYIIARSSLPNSQVADPNAVSEMDMISAFSDRPADPSRDHRPLNVIVTQYNYEWSFSQYAHFVIFHYVIRNDGPPLRNVWVGLYNELASGNMRAASSFPPSGWFKKKAIGWVDTLSMVTERYCLTNVAFPNNCNFGVAPEIVGVKYLGARPSVLADTTNIKLTFAAWSFYPGAPFLDTDSLKYDLMSRGTRQRISPLPDSLAPGTGDPVELLAAGPFSSIDTGDSVSVDFAYLGQQPILTDLMNISTLAKRAGIAQRAYDLHYLVPVPPPSPRMKIVARGHGLDYYFDDSPESFIDKTSPIGKDFEGYRVYLGSSRDTLVLVGQYDLAVPPHDTTGFNTGLDSLSKGGPWNFAGDPVTYRYRFRVDNLRDGFKYYAAVTAYDLGTSDIESLESGTGQNETVVVPAPAPGEVGSQGVTVFPNPYRVEAAWDRGQQARDHFLWFANLPEKAKLKIYTLSGDLAYSTDFDGATYQGTNARGIYKAGDLVPVMSGATFGWDMITREGQAAATGLYIWVVEDSRTGKRQTGKFLLVKSDRETF
jgi:hypothetical protein